MTSSAPRAARLPIPAAPSIDTPDAVSRTGDAQLGAPSTAPTPAAATATRPQQDVGQRRRLPSACLAELRADELSRVISAPVDAGPWPPDSTGPSTWAPVDLTHWMIRASFAYAPHIGAVPIRVGFPGRSGRGLAREELGLVAPVMRRAG